MTPIVYTFNIHTSTEQTRPKATPPPSRDGQPGNSLTKKPKSVSLTPYFKFTRMAPNTAETRPDGSVKISVEVPVSGRIYSDVKVVGFATRILNIIGLADDLPKSPIRVSAVEPDRVKVDLTVSEDTALKTIDTLRSAKNIALATAAVIFVVGGATGYAVNSCTREKAPQKPPAAAERVER